MGVYNGCGGEGGMSFSKIVRHNLELLPRYEKYKGQLFWYSIEDDVCDPHDDLFHTGGGLIAYLYANLQFSYRFSKKLWWTKMWIQVLSFPILFILINLGGVKYFNWCFIWNKK